MEIPIWRTLGNGVLPDSKFLSPLQQLLLDMNRETEGVKGKGANIDE
jgi:hypothetical protein